MGELIKNHIFTYKTCTFEEYKHDKDNTCEDVCKYLCKKLQIAPVVQFLFGLRACNKNWWLPGCRPLRDGEKYEFRIRFKVPKISELNNLDKASYDYFYHQVRYDVVNNRIPEIEYPKYKNDILGLCVTDMYVEMIENNKSVDDLMKTYRNYIPKELFKNHKIFAKKEIEHSIKSIKNKGHDAFYVKGIYLQQIDSKAPNYLTEEYSGTTPYLKEDGYKEGTCTVRLKFSPFDLEQPGLRIYYAHRHQWTHVSKIGDFYTITIDDKDVSLEIQNNPLGFRITMSDENELESFVSCISGYYRLMVKWNVDLCQNLGSPSLKFLTELKCHGPIGGAYSYSKIDEKNNSIGSFIVRQCEKVFDTYYIDIVTKENQKPETFKIMYKNNCWHLEQNNKTEEFTNLIDLAISIVKATTDGQKWFRVPPTQHDKSPLLLLCMPQNKLVLKDSTGLRSTNPLILRATDDLLINKWSQKEFGDGIFTKMKAEYKQPNNKKIDVTLKILKSSEVEKHLGDFMKLADQWAKLDLQEIIKLYGITLNQPISLVLESSEFGPLDEFLRNPKKGNPIKTLCLVEAAYSLARALHYLQENQVVHSKIRCNAIQVIHFNDTTLSVKLGDPGINLPYTNEDIPWIPIEYYHDMERAKKSLKADIWAYASTIWQIFSRGALLSNEDFKCGGHPPKPDECIRIPFIYDIMLKGWDADPERRFSPQSIFSKLLCARTTLNRDYEEVHANGHSSGIERNSNMNAKISPEAIYSSSIGSNVTEQTYVTSSRTTNYTENSSLNRSHNGSSQVSLYNGHSSMTGSQSTIAASLDDMPDEFCDEIPSYIDLGDYKLIFQGEIGRGNYGSVFRGLMESYEDETEKEVAIKLFRFTDSDTQFRDFQREAKIMKTLNCKNIVKIFGYLDNPRLLIIMEYMKHGSLLVYLSYHRPNLKEANLLNFAKSIASGMHYLECKKIVHRDLAARNVLVADEGCVKIADFGLAQFTDNTGYYHFATNLRALPLKWWSPESIKNGRFSHKSDVWSFGVTMFEMFTFGESPNLEQNDSLTAEQIINLLDQGVRLRCPENCPIDIYKNTMLYCWDINPKSRPTFAELLRITDDLLNNYDKNVKCE